MDDRLFASLLTSTRQARDHAAGKRSLRTIELPGPPAPMTAEEIRALRQEVRASQAVFAGHLNVSLKLVQAWEAGRRTPEGAALRLLRLGNAKPGLVFASRVPKRPRSVVESKLPIPKGAKAVLYETRRKAPARKR